jgi:hypothetical protein
LELNNCKKKIRSNNPRDSGAQGLDNPRRTCARELGNYQLKIFALELESSSWKIFALESGNSN